MKFARADIGLARDGVGRALPWIIAVMIYLAALILAAALGLGAAAERWRAGLSGTMTVQIAAAEDGDAGAAAARLRAVLGIVRDTPGIARAEPIPPTQVAAMLEPWLGAAAQSPDLPLPQLVDVTIAPGARVDTAALGTRLSAVAPGAFVDDHRRWLDGVLNLARVGGVVATGIVVLIAAATAATIVFATRAGLAVHHEAIELLHLMGASDGFIARRFQVEALLQGLAGGLLGLLGAVATLIGLGAAAELIDLPIVGKPRLDALHWLALALLPAGAALVAMTTARIVVLRALARLY